MPMLSEKLEKLSQSMAELAQRAKEAETRTAEIGQTSQVELQTRAADARAAADQQRKQMAARAGEARDDVSSGWASLNAHVNEQLEKMQAKIQERRDEHEVKVGQRRAEWAESYAAAAVDFAWEAILEAEAAILDAADARAVADTNAPSQGAG